MPSYHAKVNRVYQHFVFSKNSFDLLRTHTLNLPPIMSHKFGANRPLGGVPAAGGNGNGVARARIDFVRQVVAAPSATKVKGSSVLAAVKVEVRIVPMPHRYVFLIHRATGSSPNLTSICIP